jgi:uncharacterized protein
MEDGTESSSAPSDRPTEDQTPTNRRRLLQFSGAAAALGLLGYACEFERHNLEVAERTIRLARLPDALDGLRIAQISDLHYEQYAEAFFVEKVVAQVNQLVPDLVVITGDYVTERRSASCRRSAEMSFPCAEILSRIECDKRWAVLGNHDERAGSALVIKALESRGFPVLENRHVAYERNGARLWIAGVKSASESEPDLRAAVPPWLKSSGDPVLLLAHEPDFADQVVEYGGVDLMLSGHTHGGQVRLPFLGATVRPPLGRKYVKGLFRLPNDLQLYVNRGIGAMMLPVRFRCRPEITLITLRSTAAADA